MRRLFTLLDCRVFWKGGLFTKQLYENSPQIRKRTRCRQEAKYRVTRKAGEGRKSVGCYFFLAILRLLLLALFWHASALFSLRRERYFSSNYGSNNPTHKTNKQTKTAAPGSADFKSGLCDCFAAGCGTCCMGCPVHVLFLVKMPRS